jgi:CRP-like cAMP-binding protein
LLRFTFRERALVTNEPRAADVVSTSNGVAFTIDKASFEKVLGKMSNLVLRAQDARVLSAVPFIKAANLNADQLDSIASQVVETKFKAGEVIMKEGGFTDKAAIFFIRSNGEIHLKSNDRDDLIKGGEFFGESAVLDAVRRNTRFAKSPYSATATKDTVCGLLHYRKFIHMLGSIEVTEVGESADQMQEDVFGSSLAENETKLPGSDTKLEDLSRHAILGEGTFGQVWLVTDAKQKHSSTYALKIQSWKR